MTRKLLKNATALLATASVTLFAAGTAQAVTEEQIAYCVQWADETCMNWFGQISVECQQTYFNICIQRFAEARPPVQPALRPHAVPA